jgi:ParB-like chromosome segregation protein Spo0J
MSRPDEEIEAHPLAAIFPLLDGEAFEELAADIKANGLADHGVTYEGLLLDGRNRQAACRKVGVPFRAFPYEGSDPLAFVMSKKISCDGI